MNIHIRHEIPADFARVETIARDAFWNLYFPGAHEHYVVHTMRNHKDFIPELAFVIEVDGVVEGAIFYTHSHIVLKDKDTKDNDCREASPKDNTIFKTISFGPAFISPRWHRQSLGRKLITHSLERAKALGYAGVLTLGYPYHYAPYGFVGGKKYGISMEDGKFYQGLLALPLQEGAFDHVKGYAAFSDVFNVSEEDVQAFEAHLPYKEKKVQASQEEFAQACAALDE